MRLDGDAPTIGLRSIVGLLAAAAGAVVWVQTTLWTIRSDIHSIQRDVRDLGAGLVAVREEQMTRSQMALWVERFRASNPTVSVPDPVR